MLASLALALALLQGGSVLALGFAAGLTMVVDTVDEALLLVDCARVEALGVAAVAAGLVVNQSFGCLH